MIQQKGRRKASVPADDRKGGAAGVFPARPPCQIGGALELRRGRCARAGFAVLALPLSIVGALPWPLLASLSVRIVGRLDLVALSAVYGLAQASPSEKPYFDRCSSNAGEGGADRLLPFEAVKC